MANIKSKYHGIVTLPSGKTLKFNIGGESETEGGHILSDSQPKAKVHIRKKYKERSFLK